MRRKKLEAHNLESVLKLFAKRLDSFKGESRRSYQKAYSSFQIFSISHYKQSYQFDSSVVENWLIHCLIRRLKKKTVSFYLDKLSSLYSGIAGKLEGGKQPLFKEIKRKFKDIEISSEQLNRIQNISSLVQNKWQANDKNFRKGHLVHKLKEFPTGKEPQEEIISFIWGCIALKMDIRADIIKSLAPEIMSYLPFLSLTETKDINPKELLAAQKAVSLFIQGENSEWFAMRLRPKVKYDQLLNRLAILSEEYKLPELFYPNEEIMRRVGRKIEWKNKPVISDIVFFKYRRSQIPILFSGLYDIAWCYRTPGSLSRNYARIPETAMDNFKKSLGIITADFEVTPAGEMELRPGDKVVVVNGDYMDSEGLIIKKPSLDDDGNKIYRVTLLNSNGRWDIGIDARLLKKV